MTTLHSKERAFALCTLIAEEKDPDKVLLLVSELNDVLESDDLKVEPAGRTAKVISLQATPMRQ
jgi:hypothetical protein